jgi:hypothetical protein
MRGHRLVIPSILCLAIVGCGGGNGNVANDAGTTQQTTSTGTNTTHTDTTTADQPCGKVPIGNQDGTIFGIVDKPKNVDCATAQTVVQEWGRQQVGGGNYEAQLPSGWHCTEPDSGPPCRNGDQSVDLILEYPQP